MTRGPRRSPRPSPSSRTSPRYLLGWLCVLAVWSFGLSAACQGTDPGAYVVSATFNGAATTSVNLGAPVEVTVTVQLVGGQGLDSWWCKTSVGFACPENGVNTQVCVAAPDPTGGCYCNWGCLAESLEWESSFSATFTVAAPSVAGTYDVTLCALSREVPCDWMVCASPATFAGAVRVTCGTGDAPTVAIGGGRPLTCSLPTTTLTATVSGGRAPYAYLWTPGNSTAQTLAVSTSGTYSVSVVDANGCAATASLAVVDDQAAPIVDAGEPRILTCVETSLVQTASATGGVPPYTYLWTPGNGMSAAATITAPGTYTVTVTGANGCSASDTLVVTEDKQPPIVDAGPPRVVPCTLEPVTLTARVTGGLPPYSYAWTPGNETTESVRVVEPGLYTVRVTDAGGCTASDSVPVSNLDSWKQLLTNGGFEEGLSGWEVRADVAAPGAMSPQFSAVAPYSPRAIATRCLDTGTAYLEVYSEAPGMSARLIQDVTALLVPGRLYRLSGWIWRDATDFVGPVISLRYVMEDGSTPPDGVPVELRLPPDRDPSRWTYCASEPFAHVMPTGCTRAWLVIELVNATGYAWWDEIALMELAAP